MTHEERAEIGQRIREFLASEGYREADVAREFSKRTGEKFENVEKRLSLIFNGHLESSWAFLIYLYEKFNANIGFLLTGDGPPRVKVSK